MNPKSMYSENTARTSVDEINKQVPKFREFIDAVKNSNIPLTGYFYPGPKSKKSGRFT